MQIESKDTFVAISVIIAVNNRSEEVERLLDKLAVQDYPCSHFEVLICDDGSSEDISSLCNYAKRKYGLQIVYLRQENRGPGSARNLGLCHARGDILAITDSDCLPHTSWLSSIATVFENTSVGLIGGSVGYGESVYLSGKCVNFLMSSSIGAAGARNPQCILKMNFYPRTCNLAVRKHLAIAAGGFPGTRYGEDLEFSHKIQSLGVQCLYCPHVKVDHNEKRTLFECFWGAFNKGIARVYLKKRFGLHQAVHAMPCVLVVGLVVSLALVPLSAWFLVPLVSYMAFTGVVGVQGAFSIRHPLSFLVVPLYCVIMHMGYGVGYLTAVVGLGSMAPQCDKMEYGFNDEQHETFEAAR
jgi:glycosyltransferase involved in cell wall biosynthesis